MATTTAPTIQPHQISYKEEYLPESDGKPMAETDVHREQMLSLLHALQERFRDKPKVYVSGNIFVYYLDENGQRQSVSPDILVVFGVEKKDRRIYKVDEEGQAPQVVIELTSASTKVEDIVTKHYIYANLGVQEYFLFDPYSETMRPALRGFRLKGGEYTPMTGSRLRSEILGLELTVEKGRLRLYDPKTGERLRTPQEAEADRRAAEKKAAKELKARRQAEAKAAKAEAENARLRKELAKLRAKQN